MQQYAEIKNAKNQPEVERKFSIGHLKTKSGYDGSDMRTNLANRKKRLTTGCISHCWVRANLENIWESLSGVLYFYGSYFNTQRLIHRALAAI
jgi:hypothetical protein